MAESFLSFESSEEFRKKLIVRNLPPYKVDGAFSQSIGAQNYQYEASEYSVLDSPSVDGGDVKYAKKLYPLNTFGPEGGYGSEVNFNGPPLPVQSNSGPYEAPYETNMDIVNEFYIDVQYLKNVYGPEGGYDMMYEIGEIQNNNKIYLPYWDPSSFLTRDYTAFEIIKLSSNNNDESSPLSRDSYLAQIAAKNLQDLLKYRAALETLYNINLQINLDGATQPDATDSALRANAPLTQRDYTITTPNETDTFLDRLSGNYIPTSPIPGDYFNDDLKTRYTTSIGQLINVVAGRSTFLGDVLSGGIRRYVDSSQILLTYTPNGQKSTLFANLSFNRYRPAYGNTIAGGLFGNLLKTGINNLIEGTGTQLPGDFYLGSVITNPSFINSPVTQVPINEFGKETGAIVLGPSEGGQVYEGNESKLNFGLAGKSNTDGGGIIGQFIWTSPKYKDNLGFKVGIGGGPVKIDSEYNEISNQITGSESTEINFRPGSILDETQRLIDAADRVSGGARLKHVGNAMNQISKVFNDGYKEMTKGSQVLTYVDNATGSAVGQEYARVFAKDTPYYTYADLQKSQGITKSNRRFTYSILDNTYNLNIAPIKGAESTNIIDGKVKKYMFSIENLAWKSAGRPGLTYDSLPVCERGPNGGRIMWFPPYDIKFSETSIPNFNKTSFLGRPEPVYTYKETSRTGSLSWKIIVDHPSVLNLIVNKVFANTVTTQKANSIIDSFFAGCAKYDLYELAIRYNTIPIDQLKNYQEILSDPRLTNEEVAQQIVSEIPKDNNNPQNDNVASNVDTSKFSSFENKGLYFPYNEPTSPTSNYTSIYETYISETQNEYRVGEIPNGPNFLDSVVKTNYESITNDLIPQLFEVLSTNDKATVDILIVGRVSYRDGFVIAQSLSERRNDVFKQYILNKDLGSGNNLKKYETRINFKTENQIDEFEAVPSGNGPVSSCNCGKTEGGIKNQLLAKTMACNSTVIKQIIVNSPPVAPNPDKTNPNAQTAQNPDPSAQAIKPIPGGDINDKLKKNIGKKVLRLLLSECDYFQLVKENNPMFFDSLKEKIKYFDPAFHSMTPEGLNSRLTFLQQCMRPGDTIPQINEDGQPKSNDAINTTFGAPPILVLRIGDFYNTKIVPNNLQISYEPLVFDLNPEGIGVQPMIANITLSFDFIGGSGLAKPIEKLQNGLSFNYYANTEIYDERAEATEDTSAIDSKIFEALNKPVTKSDVNKPIENAGGVTIGTVTSTQNTTTSGNTGTTITTGGINYQKIFDEYITATEEHFNETVNFFKFMIDNYNYGMLSLVSNDRDYKFGGPTNSSASGATIYGKPNDVERNIGKVFNKIEDNIENDLDPIIKIIKDAGFSDSLLKKMKKNYKKFIKEIEGDYSTNILNEIQTITIKQQNYSQFYRKLNFVENGTTSSNGYDGKVLSTGKVEIYEISSTTLSSPSTYANTLDEIRGDYNKVSNDTTNFYNLLKDDKFKVEEKGFDPSTVTYTLNEVYEYITDQYTKLLYFGLSKMFLDKTKLEEFKKALVEGGIAGTSSPSVISEKIDEITKELVKVMEKQHSTEMKMIEGFINDPSYQKYKKYTEITKGKQRAFTYLVKTNAPNSVEKDLKDLYKSVNENNNKNTFIGKVKFK